MLNVHEFTESIMKIDDYKSQTIFFKLSPIILKYSEIIDIWIDNYSSLNNKINKLKILNNSDKLNRLLIVKNNIMNFLKCGLMLDYLKIDKNNHYRVIKLLEMNESKTYINFVKLSLTKNHLIETKNRTSSEISMSNYLKNTSCTVLTKSSNELYKIISNIMDIDTNDFVNTINRYFIDLYKKINCHDLLLKIIESDYHCDNLEEIIELFDKLSQLVVTEILLKTENIKSRIIKVVNKFIDIAEKFLETNNFQGFFAIVAGLNIHAIQRIKFIWKPNKNRTLSFQNHEKIITHCNGYHCYRSHLKTQSKYIPYLGIVLSDIDHILQAGIIHPETYLINTINYNVLAKIINCFESAIPLPGSVRKNYNVFRNEYCDQSIIEFIKNIKIMDEDKIYDLSYNLCSRELVNIDSIPEKIDDVDNNNKQLKNITKISRQSFGSEIRYEQMLALINGSNIKNNLDSEKYKFIYNLPIKSWTNRQVLDWLEFIDLHVYIKIFKNNQINGFVLDELNHNYLKNDLSIDKLGHRIRIIKFINVIKNLFYPV
ncbi:guanine nucleotide exchange factor and SAM domain [Megavirus chiliensis]|uniref:Guanine nucleotide exchange factor n=2 Tax=Megamimivirinae TaxID=3044648 RepID=A0A2L2DLS2_MIMIV|nr:guanine nucleotide exchange factor [Megavirus chiliensis]AEQ32439.1 guanine nucleotide exchange factor and SAM domain [Megavirus chiliensis]AVG47112.1 guanine nucleotide exchange factor [Acanthamoeba polyphaga mimivirus]